jgi:hypothetical protein
MTKQENLALLKDFSPDFPRDALKEIQENKEDYIPELLESLDFAVRNANELLESKSDYFLFTYAMFLLAEFREKKAFPYLVAMLRLPEDQIDFLLGDRLTEGFSQVLFCTYDDENLQLLHDIIEDKDVYEWARVAALNVYKLLYLEGHVDQEEIVSTLRTLIYDKLPPDDSYVVFTGIVGCVIDSHLYDMIPDVRFLYNNDRVDTVVYGHYDGFIDSIFYKERSESPYINDAISEMKWWYCFKKEDENQEYDNDSLDKMIEDMRKGIKQETATQKVQKTKKIGRNEPCPCGSGKKYKKCCIVAERSSIPATPTITSVEDKYDLLERYPKDSKTFKSIYEEEAVSIDMLVYKALNHRTIPMWVKRDWEQERLGKIYYLNDALKLFLDKCRREQISSFSAYDERFMVHYRSRGWVFALIDLIEDSDSNEITNIRQIATETVNKFS